ILGAAVARIDLVERLPRTNRRTVVLELVRVEQAELDEVLAALVGVLDGLDQALERACEGRPILLALLHPFEVLERLEVVRVLLEDLGPRRDRERRLLDLRPRRACDVEKLTQALLRILDQRELLLLNEEHLLPVATTRVEILQDRDRRGLVLVDLEHGLVAL